MISKICMTKKVLGVPFKDSTLKYLSLSRVHRSVPEIQRIYDKSYIPALIFLNACVFCTHTAAVELMAQTDVINELQIVWI